MNKKERIEQAFPGIHQAVIDFNGWQGSAAIMLDLDDKTVWTNVFASSSEWVRYHSQAIVCIAYKDDFLDRDYKTSVNSVLYKISAEGYFAPDWYLDLRDDPELKEMADNAIKLAKTLYK